MLFRSIEKGVLAQLNLPSLVGIYGKAEEVCAKILLDHKMIHFVGTDSHNNTSRSPKIKEALNKLKKFVDKDEFEKITSLNSQSVIENQLIFVDQALKVESKKKWFTFIRR